MFQDGALALVEGRKASQAAHDKRAWYAMLTSIAETRGYRQGWAAHKFKEKFGHWPPHGNVDPIDPTRQVLSWVRSRQIAWAKSRKRRA